MADSAIDTLPPPPADLPQRSLPLKKIEAPLHRICSRKPFLFYGKDGSSRFDDPQKQYGVLYAALAPEAAFAEVFLRELSRMLIDEADLGRRVLVRIDCTVRCVDMTGAGLRQLSCDNRLATEKPYNVTGQWSRALYEHSQKPDGIIYLSRHNPRFKCVALFDRCAPRVKLQSAKGLLSGSLRSWTIDQIAKYKLAML